MTKLPAIEAEALKFARVRVAYFRDHKVPFGTNFDLNCFDKSDSDQIARQFLTIYALGHPTQMMQLCDHACAGWGLAQDVLSDLIIAFEYHNQEKPTPLKNYTMRIAQGPLPRLSGPKATDHFLRNMVIIMIIVKIKEKFGLKETGSSARHASICSIVARALYEEGIALSEDDVVKIRRKSRRKGSIRTI
jgi:hypothetical protein